jgi:hypothetical protein
MPGILGGGVMPGILGEGVMPGSLWGMGLCQEFFLGFNKFSRGQRAESTDIWER